MIASRRNPSPTGPSTARPSSRDGRHQRRNHGSIAASRFSCSPKVRPSVTVRPLEEKRLALLRRTTSQFGIRIWAVPLHFDELQSMRLCKQGREVLAWGEVAASMELDEEVAEQQRRDHRRLQDVVFAAFAIRDDKRAGRHWAPCQRFTGAAAADKDALSGAIE